MTTTAAEYQKQGTALFMERDYEGAAQQFEKAKALYEAEGKTDLAHEMAVNLGLIDSRMGNYEQAVQRMNAARQYFAEIKDESREAMVIGNLGQVYLAQGNTEQAVTFYREAADTFLARGDKERYGRTMIELAEIQMRAGKLMQASVTYEIALDNLPDLNFRQRLMKGLIGIKNRLTGGGAPPEDAPDKPQNDQPETSGEKKA